MKIRACCTIVSTSAIDSQVDVLFRKMVLKTKWGTVFHTLILHWCPLTARGCVACITLTPGWVTLPHSTSIVLHTANTLYLHALVSLWIRSSLTGLNGLCLRFQLTRLKNAAFYVLPHVSRLHLVSNRMDFTRRVIAFCSLLKASLMENGAYNSSALCPSLWCNMSRPSCV